MPLGANKAAIMGVAGVTTGDVVLLSSQTASDSASISFTSGIDSTYGEYIFGFYKINPASNTNFSVQFNASGESGYNETITDTVFYATHTEAAASALAYDTSRDQAQGTAFTNLTENQANHADEGAAGALHLFNPASTTYVKHFICRSSVMTNNSGAMDMFTAGYINTTAAITNVQFKCASGNFDGVIKMWGVK